MFRPLAPLAALLLAFGLSAPSSALTLDFYEGLAHGALAVDGFADFGAYSVTVSNPNRSFDYGVAFDSGASGTRDDDLEFAGGWGLGNLDEPLGNILILQENATSCGAVLCADDENSRPLAGSWTFDFDGLFTTFAVDLLDFGDDGVGAGTIRFLRGTGEVSSFAIHELGSVFPGQNIAFGNRSANRVNFGLEDIGGPFNGIEITLFGSGALDGLIVDGATQVPEPGTAGLLGLGILGVAFLRRRSRLIPARI
jgi:hypothetical protein